MPDKAKQVLKKILLFLLPKANLNISSLKHQSPDISGLWPFIGMPFSQKLPGTDCKLAVAREFIPPHERIRAAAGGHHTKGFVR
jgi:hypothetical protein